MVLSFLLALGCSLFGVHNGIPPIWMSQNLIQRLTFLIGFSENPSTLFPSAEHPTEGALDNGRGADRTDIRIFSV